MGQADCHGKRDQPAVRQMGQADYRGKRDQPTSQANGGNMLLRQKGATS